jgi:hypothetical protein
MCRIALVITTPSEVLCVEELWLSPFVGFTDTTSKLGRSSAAQGSAATGCAAAIASGAQAHIKAAHTTLRITLYLQM